MQKILPDRGGVQLRGVWHCRFEPPTYMIISQSRFGCNYSSHNPPPRSRETRSREAKAKPTENLTEKARLRNVAQFLNKLMCTGCRKSFACCLRPPPHAGASFNLMEEMLSHSNHRNACDGGSIAVRELGLDVGRGVQVTSIPACEVTGQQASMIQGTGLLRMLRLVRRGAWGMA